MKLRKKVLLLLGLVWIPFLLLSLFTAVRYPLLSYMSLLVVCVFIMFGLLSALILKRIEHLSAEVSSIDENNYVSRRLDIPGDDETAMIAGEINVILDTARAKQNQLEQLVLERNQEIQKMAAEIRASAPNANTAVTDAHESITRLAHYDDLTSLPNRLSFNETLDKAINHAKRRKQTLAVLLVDIDGFNSINVTGGHAVGDEILKELAKRFKNALRSEDLLARLDEDEFIILLTDIQKPKFASVVAEKILQACKEPLEVKYLKYALTASIGIAIFPEDGESLETLLQNVDSALFKAKQASGNNYHYYEQANHTEAKEYVQLESALRAAISNNALSLYYQPKFDIKKGKIVGVEALLRWEHEQLGVISPSKFIAVAEESGLSMPLFEWTLREACRTNKHWQDEGYEHITMALNISAKQFYHANLAKVINSIIGETSYNPNYLELEINETTVMDDVDAANTTFANIKQTGVRFSIDHFGTGYTAISYLKQFPISAIKVDPMFIKGLPHTPNDMAIMSAFIGLGHNLGLEVIAAGVETAEQLQYLATQNCDVIQGYFLSYPLPAEKIILQLKKLSDAVMI